VVVWLERVFSQCRLRLVFSASKARAHTQYIGHLHLPPHSAAHRHLHSRLLTTAALLGWRRTLGGSAGADRGAKQRHDKLATGFHPVGLRIA